MNLSDLLSDSAGRYGERDFLLFERQPMAEAGLGCFRQRLSYREFDTLVNRACHYLAAQGLKAGDIYNLHLPNCPAFLILWFAGARLGAVMMPTNVLASADDLAWLLDHSNSKLSLSLIHI